MSRSARRRFQAAAAASLVTPIANILLGKIFSSDVADSTSEPGNTTTYMTDGSEATRWISLPTSPVNATVDMAGMYSLSQVRIVFAADTIKNYHVDISSNGSSWTQFASGITNNTSSQTIVHSGLSGVSGRYLRVTGTDRWNSGYGNSIWEISAAGTLTGGVPTGSLTGFTATVTSNTTVNLAWAYSGSILSSIAVRRNGLLIATLAGNATSYPDSGLSAGTSYSYTLTGTYQAGGVTGTVSQNATTTGGAVTPQYSVGNLAIHNMTSTQLTLTWSRPSDVSNVSGYIIYDGGSPILYQSVWYSGLNALTTTGLTYTHSGLTPGSSHTFTVKTVQGTTETNGSEIGAGSVIQATLPSSDTSLVPIAPLYLGVTTTSGQASIKFNTSARATSYQVTASTGQTASGSSSPIVVTGLSNLSRTSFTMTAINANGASESSLASSSTIIGPSSSSLSGKKVALIGDSLSEQYIAATGQTTGSSAIPSSLTAVGWSQVWMYALGGKAITDPDGSGKTTMTNIDECRAAIGEPDLWIIALCTNGGGDPIDAINSRVDTVLAKLGSSAKVMWVNQRAASPTIYDLHKHIATNSAIEAKMNARTHSYMADLFSYIEHIDQTGIWYDSVHMTQSGYNIRNQFIAQKSVEAYNI